MSQIEQTIEIDAPPAAVWAVLADFGAISQWVPLVGHSCLTTARGDGVGATRRVQIARQTLLERVTTWKPGRLLTYTVEGLPPMAGIPLTTWELTPSGDGTRVRLTTALDTGVNPIRALVVMTRFGPLPCSPAFFRASGEPSRCPILVTYCSFSTKRRGSC